MELRLAEQVTSAALAGLAAGELDLAVVSSAGALAAPEGVAAER